MAGSGACTWLALLALDVELESGPLPLDNEALNNGQRLYVDQKGWVMMCVVRMQGFGKLGLGGRNSSNRVFGQKIGSNDKHNEWKLFIGQVPLEVCSALVVESPKMLSHLLSLQDLLGQIHVIMSLPGS